MDSGGDCSAIVALDPERGAELWRTGPLVSNQMMLPVGPHIVAGYGFAMERDLLRIVRRSDGAVLGETFLPTAPVHLASSDTGTLHVTLRDGTVREFAMRGWDGSRPRLEPVGG